MNHSDRTRTIARTASYIVAGILVLLPFHAVFTTWLGANFGYIDLFRIWKELIIFGLLLPLALYIAWSDSAIRRWTRSSWLATLLLFYVVLHLLIGYMALVQHAVTPVAFVYALLINLRFLGFFVIVTVFVSHSDFLMKHWRTIIIGPAVVVIVFGLLQLVLPYNFLEHLGYGPHTIPAYQTVDQKLQYRRIQSTLRGANPLGAYLVLLLPLLVVGVRSTSRRWVLGVAGVLTLLFTYSRSAWLGLVVTAAILVYWKTNARSRRIVFAAAALMVVLGVAGVFAFRNSNVVQNSLFHTDETSRSSVSSNASRLYQIKQATKDVVHEPLGRGPGTAGPASFRNDKPARIAENYFLQIGQEVGVMGVVTFICINLLVVRALWRQRSLALARVLLATWAGITLINLVSHAWSDDTLVYLWWGLAAMVAAPAILNEKRKRYAKK